MNSTQTAQIQSEYADVVQTLQALTNRHEKTYRLEVGRLVLQRFFGGSAAAFSDRDHTKASKFNAFLDQHAEDVAGMELSEQTLRRCVRVALAYDTLPTGVRDQLNWSILLAVSAVGETNLRARIAMAALSEGWTVAKTRAVVEQAQHNRVWDADPSTPGLQLPPPAAAPRLQPGRLVTQTEKWGQEIEAWQQDFAQVDPRTLSKQQVARLRAAVQKVRGQLEALEGALG